MNKSIVIPVYLNQAIVFDVIASLHDGLAKVERVHIAEGGEASVGGNAEVGANNIFALLGVSLSGKASKKNSNDTEMEKVHTPSSLFNTMKQELESEGLVKRVTDSESFNNLQLGDFIELEGTITKNPLVDFLEQMLAMLDLALVLAGGSKKKRERDDTGAIKNQIKALLSALQHDGIMDMICKNQTEEFTFSAVMPMRSNYFSTQSRSEIIDGHFKVFAKITNICKADQEINLLRSTALKILDKKTIDEFTSQMNDSAGELNIDEMQTMINGPALLLLPIAIYV